MIFSIIMQSLCLRVVQAFFSRLYVDVNEEVGDEIAEGLPVIT